jgi:short subunit dehydrogenase-like uncharacterized protein
MSNQSASGPARDREFDLVVVGATGFTGRLVAEYLVGRRTGLRIALAGRNRAKLESIRDGLASIDGSARDIPLVIVDTLDPASVDSLAQRTRVVCTTVGPYARYGRPLVDACATHGTHYCDLTGETLFVRESIDANHERAVASGARIVHCAGFDSIPSDLGVWMVHEHFRAHGKRLAEARMRVVRMKGTASGGTIASAAEIASRASDPAVRRILGDPYALDPRGSPRGHDRDQHGPERDPETGRWTAPFVMAAINTRVVRRTNALLGHPYGTDFRYSESTDMGRGPRGLLGATALSAAIGAGLALLAVGPTRRLAMRLLPQPGEGPSKEARDAGGFTIVVNGVSEDGARAKGTVVGYADPGYGETAKMLGESALGLAMDELDSSGGVLTPASAMGAKLLERLRAAGMTWQVE